MAAKAVLFGGMVLFIFGACSGQTLQSPVNNTINVGGPFEGRDIMFVNMPKNIAAVDTSPGWFQQGQKLLISGTIYHRDGKTPAPDVILYYYHTDIHGLYSDRPGLDRRAVRHGYIRGWVKSDAKGHYAIYTVRPAPYPGEQLPAHIHPAVKEPNQLSAYYLDEFHFDDDRLLTGKLRKNLEQRGGSGVLRLSKKGDLQIAEHNIVLGLNIPNYPSLKASLPSSGREIGEDQPSFMPFHAWGPDKGQRACPVCKYGHYHGLLYFVGRNPEWQQVKAWLRFLEQESQSRGKYLKVYFIYGNDQIYDHNARQKQLADLGRELSIKHVAVTFVPSFTDTESEIADSKISPEASNTFILYRNRTIVDKYQDLPASPANFTLMRGALERTKRNYFVE